MIQFELDREAAILHVHPLGALGKEDFEALAKSVDPFIEEQGKLAGLVIETPSFPGWNSLGAMIDHFRFVKDHHKKVRRIALVTDSRIGEIAEKIASHFVAAEIKHFPGDALEAVKAWIQEREG